MRAVVMREFGGPAVLQIENVPAPEPSPGGVIVKLRASALNWHDVLVREGRYSSPLPHILGADGAGVRVDTGEAVMILPSLWWGERQAAPGPQFEILGDRRPGTYADAVWVPVESVIPKPRGWSWEQAAALPLVGVTTWRALHSRGRLRTGESLLVLGAGGGVATMAVSVAQALGVHVVVTSSSETKIAQAVELGATGGVLYTNPEWVSSARALSPNGAGFDVVLDSVGSWDASIACLRPGGRLVVLGASRSESVSLAQRPFYFGQYELIGTTMGSNQDFSGLLELVATGALAPPPIAGSFSLSEATAAHQFLETGDGFGKVILSQ